MRSLLVQWLACLLGSLILGQFAAADPRAEEPPLLRYGFQPNQRLAYDVKIVGKIHDFEITDQGVIELEELSASSEQFVLKISGELVRSTQGKPPTDQAAPVPMARLIPTASKGSSSRSDACTFDRQGNIVAFGRVNQLPFLVGTQQQLVLEPLAKEAKAAWSTTNTTQVLETPGRLAGGRETATSAVERCDYAIVAATPESIRLSKKYSLTTAAPAGAGRQLAIAGSGELLYDRKRGIFQSCKMTYEILVKQNSLARSLPVTLEYSLAKQSPVAQSEKKLDEKVSTQPQVVRVDFHEPAQTGAKRIPAVATQPVQNAPAVRLWHDASGRYSVEATPVRFIDNQVTLEKKDGSQVIVSLDKLSKPDQAWLKQHGKP